MNSGIISVNGQQYVERFQVFPSIVTVATNGQLQPNLIVALPGSWPFRLKMLTRDVIVNGARASRPFLFRLGSSDGTSWYMGGQNPGASSGTFNNRVLDTNVFGTGQFPYPIVPDILYPTSSQITFDVEDVSQQAPYTIYFAFHGTYLVPVNS